MTIVKIIELIGTSPNSWSEAAQNAVTEAAKTIKNIKGVHVKRCTAKVTNDKIVEYNVNVKIAFTVERWKLEPTFSPYLFLSLIIEIISTLLIKKVWVIDEANLNII